MMHPEILSSARQAIGGHLKTIRIEKGISAYKIKISTGLSFDLIKKIEAGGNYTMDSFLTYIAAIDCYFFLRDKGEKQHDFENLLNESIKGTEIHSHKNEPKSN